ncbi:MAG: AraC family transcriptional regulator [Candidatus Acidiferrales bacterium]
MAKIAVELNQAQARRNLEGEPGRIAARRIAEGHGWSVSDLVCTCGPPDRPFEEKHSGFSIAIVAAGTFQYRSAAGNELMTPGSLMLGNAGQQFECAHSHGRGDRCLSIGFTPDYFERLAADAGFRRSDRKFRALRLPPVRDFSALAARALAGLAAPASVSWEELSLRLAANALRLGSSSLGRMVVTTASTQARVTRSIRLVELRSAAKLTLGTLAQEAGLSPYHFLRVFQQLTGATPHQYIVRTRLREAARRLAVGPAKILDIALDCGFSDASNFNHSFLAEFGVSPRVYRLQSTRKGN